MRDSTQCTVQPELDFEAAHCLNKASSKSLQRAVVCSDEQLFARWGRCETIAVDGKRARDEAT